MLDVQWELAFITLFIHEDSQGARNYAEKGLSAAQEAGDLFYEMLHQYLLACAFTSLEKWSEAEELFGKSIEILKKIGLQGEISYRWAGLARLYLAQGLPNQAVQQVDLILDDLAANQANATNQPAMLPLHTCCLVLRAANDPRFPQVLAAAYNHLQNLADKIPNEDLRKSFLNNIPWHRGIAELWEAEQENKTIGQS